MKDLLNIFTGISTSIINVAKTTAVQHQTAVRQQQIAVANERCPLIQQEVFFILTSIPIMNDATMDLPGESVLRVRMLTPTLYKVRIPLRTPHKLNTLTLHSDLLRTINQGILRLREKLYCYYGREAERMYLDIYRLMVVHVEQSNLAYIEMVFELQ